MPSTEANNATMSTKIRAEEELSSCLCCVRKTSPPRNFTGCGGCASVLLRRLEPRRRARTGQLPVSHSDGLRVEVEGGYAGRAGVSLGRPLRAIHQNLIEIPMNKKIEHKGKRTRWRSALARKKERAPAKWWNVRPLTTSTKWKEGDDNYNDDGATRLQGNDLGWEFRFGIPISGRAGIRNSASDLGIPMFFRGKKIGKIENCS